MPRDPCCGDHPLSLLGVAPRSWSSCSGAAAHSRSLPLRPGLSAGPPSSPIHSGPIRCFGCLGQVVTRSPSAVPLVLLRPSLCQPSLHSLCRCLQHLTLASSSPRGVHPSCSPVTGDISPVVLHLQARSIPKAPPYSSSTTYALPLVSHSCLTSDFPIPGPTT